MRFPYSEDDKTATGLVISCENIEVSLWENHSMNTWQLPIAKCAVARGKMTGLYSICYTDVYVLSSDLYSDCSIPDLVFYVY